ncbi:MAG TPA: multifunctional oxoglutarate decarboxylase/oxoglutarate dehydrogenase thiamine pyrophosphate-binding subunit/dihydrolipoyllysine-residue succinyltransferase subunit [Acidimicrobiales bacterium]|nr:multifunctional oxoglutarate decarboxylase/oxoglutarate dehydrogenase thiamine pyrophosphate-binding subunit/dihydrolipoyllysine-residue succinyltransferase subunit [Acidimicrobiales bacterium]
MGDAPGTSAVLGPNAWLVDDMYERYLADPGSVSESWRDFFADYRREADHAAPTSPAGPVADGGAARAPTGAAEHGAPAPGSPPGTPGGGAARAPREVPSPGGPPVPGGAPEGAPDRGATPRAPATSGTGAAARRGGSGGGTGAGDGEPLRGVAARIAENMEASLRVPTATSFRDVPAKLLEVNRRVINGYLGRTRGGKVSFTHIIGFAVVRALHQAMPRMNATFVEGSDGAPRVVRHEHVGLGLAVDVERPDGSRNLVVPVIRDADAMDFRTFWGTYEDLIRKVRSGKLSADDLAGATVTLTNPGTLGTRQSVPRLMPGQGVIVGVGAIDFPAEWRGADPVVLADLGASKVITVTSTYDHRIIQGAESGIFLQRVEDLLLGADRFYDEIFASLDVPYEAIKWRRDVNPVDSEQTALDKQMAVATLIRVYRVRGHLIADLDPLRWKGARMAPELDPATYGLTIWDLDREFRTGGLGGHDRMALGEILRVLRDAYCRTIGIEYMHIQDLGEQRWIQEQVENQDQPVLDVEDLRHILDRLNAAEAFERFLGTKWIGQKRFGIEGSESLIPVLDAVLEAAADDGLEGAVMGMAHRGRLNVLTTIVGKNYEEVFKDFEGTLDPTAVQGSGDVKYHLGQTGKFQSRQGSSITVEVAANPSHLEAVDPVVEGEVRAKQDQINVPEAYSVLPVLVHGDAAFAGQGVVAETLNMSDIKGYRVGGTVHVVVNNQIGFTTMPEAARSGFYCTDVAKIVQAPILHVNGDDPEACVRVARLAYAYRQRFHKDVVIDLVSYRRHGHNEGDDPSYTQPLMYAKIDQRRSVRKLFTESLVKRGLLSLEEAERSLDDFQRMLQQALDETRQSAPPANLRAAAPPPPVGCLPPVETGVDRPTLDRIYATLGGWPDDFAVHPKLAKQFAARDKMVREDGQVDWATAEAMAFGSLLLEGTDIRLAGQDSRRGTFSQRHAVLVDHTNGAEWAPLAHVGPEQAKFWIYDSLLSEYAALGFEYGYSVANKDALVCWEAQFGDFVNGASIVVDEYVVAAEEKWGQSSGLVLLLPHGYEGQGPDHSSARIERFLTLCAEDNIQVANATTAAQYFHLLRRQMHRDVRKPLVLFTPKSLLRARAARSSLDELTSGHFREVLDDPRVPDPDAVRRIVLCSGKVGQEALAERDKRGVPVAVVRVEQLYPWPEDQLVQAVGRYPRAREIVWLQEEPANMGAWAFVQARLAERFAGDHDVLRVSRHEAGSPATGSHTIHVQEQEAILEAALEVG